MSLTDSSGPDGLPRESTSPGPDPHDPTPIATARRQLGGAAILSVAEAARLLPIREADAAMWLAANDLIRDLDGRRVVVWSDVVARLRGDEDQPAPPPHARLPRAGLPRGPRR